MNIPQIPFRAFLLPFNQFVQMSQQGEFVRYIIDPVMQRYSGAPGGPNKVFTFFIRNGESFMVEGKYSPETNQIFPPI